MAVAVQARRITKRDLVKSCPPNTSGEYPHCVCENGAQFNEIHNICPPRSLESLGGSCPDDSTGELGSLTSLYQCLNNVEFNIATIPIKTDIKAIR